MTISLDPETGNIVKEQMAIVPALSIALPIAAALFIIMLFVVTEAAGWHPYTVAPAVNVAGAVTYGDGARALALIADGQDPDERWVVERDAIDSGRALRVTAIEAAMLTRRPEFVGLMLHHGAHPDAPSRLACLAQAMGLDAEVKPSLFGVRDGTYYTGPQLHSIEALEACGIPSE
jgi:hypothetical protein